MTTLTDLRVRSNQSLKLTEPAVDDFAARCWTDLGASDWNVRATSYMAAAVRRRSLAPVRSLGGVNIESKQKTCDSTSTFSDSFQLQPLRKELQDEKNILSHLDNYCNYLNKWP